MPDQIGTIKTPRGVTKDAFLDQVRAGVFDAMRELMTSGATGTPHDDFYGAVRDGIREAVRATVTVGQLRPVPT